MKILLSTLILLALSMHLVAQAPPATNSPTAIPTRTPRAPGADATNTAPAAPSVPPIPSRVAPFTPATQPPSGTLAQPVQTSPGGRPAIPTAPAPRNAFGAPGGGTVPLPANALGGTNFMRTPGSFTTNAAGEKVLKAGVIKFQAAPLEQVLDIYAELMGRTILRPASLPAAQITLKTQSDLTLKEAKEALDSVLSLNGISTVPVGEKFITVVPTAQVQGEAMVFNSNTNSGDLPEAGQYLTKIVQLTFAKPSEIIPALQPFGKVQNGILAIDNNGILILRDNSANIKRMLEIIEKVDVAVPLNEELEVIPIRFALASDIASVLSSLTSGGGGAGGATSTSGRTPSTRGRSNSRGTGGFGTGTTGFGTGAPGSYPGGVTTPGGIGSPAGINPASGISSPGNNAASFADRLRQSINNAIKPGGAGSQLLGDAKILADERTNSLLVFGNADDRAQVKKVVNQLDLIQAQVLIEAIILEVSLDNNKTIGVSSAQTPAKKFLSNVSGFGGNNNGNFFSSTNSPAAGNLPQGFSYFGALGANWQVAVEALATDSSVNVLSRPRIQTFHATEASLFVGDTVPYITGTISDINGGARSQYQQTQVGITLNVLPLINPEGLVVMDIQQNIEQLGTPTIIDGNSVPTTTKRQASAKVAVQDGETIILGGFISSTKSQTKSGIPYLKDIPWIGGLFRNKSDTSRRVELIVLMRPTVLKTPEAASLTAFTEQEKMAGVKRAEMQLRDEDRLMNEQNEAIMKKMKENEKK